MPLAVVVIIDSLARYVRRVYPNHYTTYLAVSRARLLARIVTGLKMERASSVALL